MVKVKYGQMLNFGFHQAMMKLKNSPLESKTAYWIMRISKKLESARKEVLEKWEKDYREVYAERDDDGNIKPVEGGPPGGNGFTVTDEKKEDFAKAQKEFMETEWELEDINQISMDKLNTIKFTAQELEMLEGIYAMTE